jgi:hypothetical protein
MTVGAIQSNSLVICSLWLGISSSDKIWLYSFRSCNNGKKKFVALSTVNLFIVNVILTC